MKDVHLDLIMYCKLPVFFYPIYDKMEYTLYLVRRER